MKYFSEWKNSWTDLFNNLKLLVPDILFIIFEILFAGVILWTAGLFPIVKTLYLDKDLSVIGNSLVRIIVSGLIFAITSFVLGAGVRAVKYNYITDVIKKKKVDFGKFFIYSQKDMWKVISVRILLFFIFFGLIIGIGIISGLLSLFTPKNLIPLIAVLLVGLLLMIYAFSVLFVYPIMFLKGKKAWESIKLSFDYFRNNIKHVILVWLVITLTAIVLTSFTKLTNQVFIVLPLNFVAGLFLGIWSLLYLFRAL